MVAIHVQEMALNMFSNFRLVVKMSRFGTSSLAFRHLLKHRDITRPLGAVASRVPSARDYGTQHEIEIPKRIPRGPTDILKALSSTVQRDMTAADFKYMDDPFLIPASLLEKKSHALAQEAGRKAARWIKEEHANLFQHKVAEPFITAFAPIEKITENSPVTEELLIRMIKTIRVKDAITVYQRLEDSGTEISQATKQTLLEMVAFFNEEDDINEDWIEERAYITFSNKDEGFRKRKTWKDNGMAEKLFQSIDPKTPEAYCAIISGMATYGHAEGAWIHYKQMKDAGFMPDVTTYNHLISLVALIKEGADKKWSIMEETLKEMVNNKTKPNVRTLNAVMETISSFTIIRAAREYAIKTLMEFQGIGIEPSLATYYHLMNVHFRLKQQGSSDPSIMEYIINRLEKRVPPLQDIKDMNFFPRAMEICNNYLDAVYLAKRLYNIYVRQSSRVFAADAFMVSTFYRHFLLLLCRMETPEQFMEYYSVIVPNVASVDAGTMETIMNTIASFSAAHYVPQLWNDAVYMELISRDKVAELMTAALASGIQPPGTPHREDGEVYPILTTARSIWTHVENAVAQFDPERRQPSIKWTGVILGNLIKVFLQYGDFPSASKAMSVAYALRSKLSNFVSVDALNLLVDWCVLKKATEPAMMAVEYAADIGYPEVVSMAKKVATSGLELEAYHKSKLAPLLAMEQVRNPDQDAPE